MDALLVSLFAGSDPLGKLLGADVVGYAVCELAGGHLDPLFAVLRFRLAHRELRQDVGIGPHPLSEFVQTQFINHLYVHHIYI